jgi:hypothetical protein
MAELAFVLVAGYQTVVGSFRLPRVSDSCRVATANVFDGARGGAGDALGFADAFAPRLGDAPGTGEPDATTSPPDGDVEGSAVNRAGGSDPQAARASDAMRAAARAASAGRGDRTG